MILKLILYSLLKMEESSLARINDGLCVDGFVFMLRGAWLCAGAIFAGYFIYWFVQDIFLRVAAGWFNAS